MEIQTNLADLFKKSEENIKVNLDQIRYDLARKNLTKTPSGVEIFLDESIDLLAKEVFVILNQIKDDIYKPKEWEPIYELLKQFIETHCTFFLNFLVSNWKQSAPEIEGQLKMLKSTIIRETDSYIDRQKMKLSKREHLTKDLIKIFFYGLAAGIVGFLLKFFLSR